MPDQHFYIHDNIWAEQNQDTVRFYRKTSILDIPGEQEILMDLRVDTIRNVLTWADHGQSVTASLTGPMASAVREAAKELGLTPEMFIWHAVKVFIEIGSS